MFRQSEQRLSTFSSRLQGWYVISVAPESRPLIVLLGLLYYLYLFGARISGPSTIFNSSPLLPAFSFTNVIVVTTVPVRF
jgi:hypothetical protein